LELLRRIDYDLSVKRKNNSVVRCSHQIIGQVRSKLIQYYPSSDRGLEQRFQVEYTSALEQLLSYGPINQVMLAEELGLTGYLCVPDDDNGRWLISAEEQQTFPRVKLYEVF
jgi:hypothetical protein